MVKAALDDAAKWIEQALEKKGKKSYPKPCILAVDVHPERRLGLPEWATLASRVDETVDRQAFRHCFVVEWGSNTVFMV